MKNIYSLVMLAAMVVAASCATEPAETTVVPAGTEVEVSFSTELPGLASRAIADGNTVDEVLYGIYAADGDLLEDISGTLEMTNGVATLQTRLVSGKTYTFVFWAQKSGNGHYTVTLEDNKAALAVDYKSVEANNEKLDAFFLCEDLKVEGPVSHTFILKRPFAQLNYGTTDEDLAAAKAAGVELSQSTVKVSSYNALDLFTGEVSGTAAEVEFVLAAVPSVAEELVAEGTLYRYIATTYTLVNEKELFPIEATFVCNDGTEHTIAYPAAPLQRNYRTNVLGSLLTNPADLTIVVDPAFEDEDQDGASDDYVIPYGDFTLTEDLTIVAPLKMYQSTNINLNGHTLTLDNSGNNADIFFRVYDGAVLTFSGEGTVVADNAYVAAAFEGGKIVVNGGDFTGYTSVFQSNGGDIEINDGTFAVAPSEWGATYLLNHTDKVWNTTGNHYVIKGGKFVGFNPADNEAEPGDHANFLTDEYVAIESEAGVWSVVAADATVEVANAVALASVLNAGLDAVVTADVTLDAENAVNIADGVEATLTINDGVTVTIPATDSVDLIKNYGTLTLNGNGTIAAGNDEKSRRCVYNYGEMVIDGVKFVQTYSQKGAAINNEGKLTIEDATVEAVFYSIWTSGANAETIVNGGTFTTTNDVNDRENWAYAVNVLNGAKLTVNGGTFTGNHGAIATATGGSAVLNAGTFHCTAGYTGNSDWALYAVGSNSSVIYNADACTITNVNTAGISATKDGGVVKAMSTPATSAQVATAAGEANAYVLVPAGEYTFPKTFGENATLVCDENTVFTGTSSLNVNGATVIGGTFSNESGSAVSQTINGTFKDCSFVGKNGLRYCYAGETVVFENCVFSGSTYGAHFDGGSNDVVFRNCTFSGFNAFGAAVTNLTFEGCTFKSNGVSGYNGANLWGSTKLVNCEFTFDGSASTEWIDCIGTEKTYEFENCTVNGVAFTSSNYADFSEYIRSRNSVVVKVDGVDCQF
ncbi:MAG: right-handed parallel beta-helix repeat-containing protein [Alistipes sp.]|nr:right-handed parallel beta-helix repeat-containing protein [Alistipes sp.]